MSNLQLIQNDLFKMATEFEKVLPKSLSAEKFIRIAITEIKSNPKLMECSRESLLGALMQSAELGLNLSKQIGHCFLVPYRSKEFGMQCSLLVGYKGYIELGVRSGAVKSIQAFIVREGDLFEVVQGTEQKINHVLNLENENKPVIAAYAVACLGQQIHQFEVMSRKEIDKIKSNSKSAAIWNKNYEEMAKKTAIRRLLKYIPTSPELEKAFSIEAQEQQQKKEKVSVLNEQ